MQSINKAVLELTDNIDKLLQLNRPLTYITDALIDLSKIRKLESLNKESYYRMLLEYVNKSRAKRQKIKERSYSYEQDKNDNSVLLFVERLMLAEYELQLGYVKYLELRTLILEFCDLYIKLLKTLPTKPHSLLYTENAHSEPLYLNLSKYHLYLYIIALIKTPLVIRPIEEDSYARTYIFKNICTFDLLGILLDTFTAENGYLTANLINLNTNNKTTELCPFL